MATTTPLVYALSDPRDGQLKYIGKSSNLRMRINHHLCSASRRRERTYKSQWLSGLIGAGLRPIVEVIEECPDDESAMQDESYWIAQFRAMGANLTNLTDGGDGAKGRVLTEEHKRKIGAAHLGKPGPMIGKKHSAETRAKMSRSAMGNKRGLGGKGRTGIPHTAEWKALMSKKMSGSGNPMHGVSLPVSQETREKRAVSMIGNQRWRGKNGIR